MFVMTLRQQFIAVSQHVILFAVRCVPYFAFFKTVRLPLILLQLIQFFGQLNPDQQYWLAPMHLPKLVILIQELAFSGYFDHNQAAHPLPDPMVTLITAPLVEVFRLSRA